MDKLEFFQSWYSIQNDPYDRHLQCVQMPSNMRYNKCNYFYNLFTKKVMSLTYLMKYGLHFSSIMILLKCKP